jgi:hypothetical protein
MIKKRITILVSILIVSFSTVSCSKIIRPSEVEGIWKSVKEDWTITIGGEVKSVSFDYGGTPTEQSAILELGKTSFEVFSSSSSESKSFNLADSDRFSPVDAVFFRRVPTKMTVSLRRSRLTGTGEAVWGVSSIWGNRMVIDYDSGPLVEDNADGSGMVEVRRKCRFVFVK